MYYFDTSRGRIMNWQDKAKLAMRVKGITQEKLATELGVSQGGLGHWLNGRREPSLDVLEKMAKNLGYEIADFIADRKSPVETIPVTSTVEDYTIIPFYDARASCGGGYSNEEYPELLKGRPFDKMWLKKRGLQHQYLMLIRASGDSMNPTITNGSALLVNKSIDNVLSGKIYLINDGEGERVKRLFREPTGNWRIASDNPNKNVFPDFTVTDEQMKQIKVVGRIVWHDEDL